jgi:hypothetical protein
MESFRRPMFVRLSRSWNPGPKNQISTSWNPGPESETQCPFIEVLRVKPNVCLSKSWNPGPKSQMQQRGLAGTGELCPTVTGTH